MNQKSRRLR